jgi:hypothetical protein
LLHILRQSPHSPADGNRFVRNPEPVNWTYVTGTARCGCCSDLDKNVIALQWFSNWNGHFALPNSRNDISSASVIAFVRCFGVGAWGSHSLHSSCCEVSGEIQGSRAEEQGKERDSDSGACLDVLMFNHQALVAVISGCEPPLYRRG